MKLSEAIELANRTEDKKLIRDILEGLRFRRGMNYQQSRELFAKCGIDAGRFEELCQLADEAQ